MITQPIKLTPVIAEDSRDITEQERKFYKAMYDHYRDKCLLDPCNRPLRQIMKMYLEIISSGKIGTREDMKRVADPD